MKIDTSAIVTAALGGVIAWAVIHYAIRPNLATDTTS